MRIGIIITAGHSVSQMEDNSSDGDSTSERNPALTGFGCYKNYDHVATHRKSSHNVVSLLTPISIWTNCFVRNCRPLLHSLIIQHSDPDGDYAPPYSSPIASQNRALISESTKDDDLDFEECEPLTKRGDNDEGSDSQAILADKHSDNQHRHTKAPLHMMASRAVCSFCGLHKLSTLERISKIFLNTQTRNDHVNSAMLYVNILSLVIWHKIENQWFGTRLY